MEEQKPLAAFSQRTTGKLPLLILILVAMNLGLGLMFILIMADAPIWLCMIALMGSMYLAIMVLAQKAEYTLYADGLKERVRALTGTYSLRKARETFYAWKDLEYYTDGEDLTRAMWVKPYLKLKFKNHRLLQIYASFKEDVPAFREFLAAFKQQLVIKPMQSAQGQAEQGERYKASAAPIRRPGFYERPIAKIITLFFVIICSTLIALAFTQPEIISPTSMWRIESILIPGTLYMVYRSFTKR